MAIMIRSHILRKRDRFQKSLEVFKAKFHDMQNITLNNGNLNLIQLPLLLCFNLIHFAALSIVTIMKMPKLSGLSFCDLLLAGLVKLR